MEIVASAVGMSDDVIHINFDIDFIFIFISFMSLLNVEVLVVDILLFVFLSVKMEVTLELYDDGMTDLVCRAAIDRHTDNGWIKCLFV